MSQIRSQGKITKPKEKKLIDIFKQMNGKQKEKLKQFMLQDRSYKMSQEKNAKNRKFQQINQGRQQAKYKSKVSDFDQNDIRDLYSILEMTLKQSFSQVDSSFITKIPKNPLKFGKITLKSLQNVPYQFLFGGLIQFSEFERVIIRDQQIQGRIQIVIQLFKHCQELRFPQINLKFPQFNNFFKNVQSIRFPNLRSLYLQNCAIQSIESLSLMDLPVLGVLNLESNMISRIDSLAKFYFQNEFFQLLYLRGNMINDFSKFHRMKIKILINFRLNGQVLFSPKEKEIQSEDLSFLVKKSFSIHTIRFYTQKRINQKKVIGSLYRMDQKVYIYRA